MKVIASSVRKGNILELDGQLYSVLTAESFFPGKGTPTTQVEMRRLSDGVKTVQRYKTTEQVERAYVEDREHSYLYQDGESYVFMNPENFEQVHVSADVIGDLAPYLQEGMVSKMSHFRGQSRLDRAAAEGDAGSDGDGADDEGPDGLILLQARDALQRRAHAGASAHRARHADRGDDGGRELRGAREGVSGAGTERASRLAQHQFAGAVHFDGKAVRCGDRLVRLGNLLDAGQRLASELALIGTRVSCSRIAAAATARILPTAWFISRMALSFSAVR